MGRAACSEEADMFNILLKTMPRYLKESLCAPCVLGGHLGGTRQLIKQGGEEVSDQLLLTGSILRIDVATYRQRTT